MRNEVTPRWVDVLMVLSIIFGIILFKISLERLAEKASINKRLNESAEKGGRSVKVTGRDKSETSVP